MISLPFPSTLSGRLPLYLLGAFGLAFAAYKVLDNHWTASEGTWTRHTIDRSLDGADGTRLADVNGDGLLDVMTGWEESGTVRIAFHPGHQAVTSPWPTVSVGTAVDVEDAVAADVDGDGAMDIISASEGDTRTLSIHWAPQDDMQLLNPEAWQTNRIAASAGRRWMFTLPINLDRQIGQDVVAGSKGDNAGITLFRASDNSRDAQGWTAQDLYQGEWIMSLIGSDLNGDGHLDILASDRRGAKRGILWLENPGPSGGNWTEHRVGSTGQDEVMFIELADLDGDGLDDVVGITREGEILIHTRLPGAEPRWDEGRLPPPNPEATGKAVTVGDLDCDGLKDLVVSHEGARRSPGVIALYQRRIGDETTWEVAALSDHAGRKFDLVLLEDLDGDGDLDVLTSEEKSLGVVWYENPTTAKGDDSGLCAG